MLPLQPHRLEGDQCDTPRLEPLRVVLRDAWCQGLGRSKYNSCADNAYNHDIYIKENTKSTAKGISIRSSVRTCFYVARNSQK